MARLHLAEAALARLDEIAAGDCAADDVIDRARASLQVRLGHTRARIDGTRVPEPVPQAAGLSWSRRTCSAVKDRRQNARAMRPCRSSRATAAGAHDQHIVRAAGQIHQHPARGPAFNMRLYPRFIGHLAPHCHQRVPELLASQVPACLSQFPRRRDPMGAVTAWQFPGDDRNQHRIVRARQDLPVAQGVQAPRRAARPDDEPACTEHRSARVPGGFWIAAHLLCAFFAL